MPRRLNAAKIALEMIDARERPAVERALDETLRGERPFLRVQCRVRTQGGELKWIETHARVMRRGADGSALRLTGTCADITDRKDFEVRQAEFMATDRAKAQMSRYIIRRFGRPEDIAAMVTYLASPAAR